MSDVEMVPKETMLSRLSSKDEQIRALKAEIAAQADKIAAFPDVAKLEKTIEKLKADGEQSRQEFELYREQATTSAAMVALGITDPEDQALVRHKFTSAESNDFGAWLEKDAKEDRHLKAFFASEQPTETKEEPQVKVVPDVSVYSSDRGALTSEAIRNMSPRERIEKKDQIWEFLRNR